MMKTTKLLSRQLMGKRPSYTLIKSIVVSLFIFLIMSASEVHIDVKPFFFYISIGLLNFVVSRQATKSLINDGKLNGLIQLPLGTRYFLNALLCSICLYVLGTKTLILLALFASVMEITLNILLCGLLISVVCSMFGMFFALPQKLPKLLALLCLMTWSIFAWFSKDQLILASSFSSLLIAGFLYFRLSLYNFIRTPIFHKQKTIVARGSFISYLFRYFIFHKNYLINSLGIIAVAAFLPFMFLNMSIGSLYLFGLGILSVNTPLAIIFSSNRTLLEKVKSFPNQKRKMIVPYFLCLFVWNGLSYTIYIVVSQILGYPFAIEFILLAFSLIIINSVSTVLLEWYFPLKKWQVESDLWRHPRKYIVPSISIVLIMAVLINQAFVIAVGFLALCNIGLLIMAGERRSYRKMHFLKQE